MIRRIVIVGGGAPGWMAAAVLARGLGGLPVGIQLLETPSNDDPLAAATLPSLRHLHRVLGLSEEAVMAAARGGFRLGVRFDGWSGPGTSRFLPFGETGAPLGPVAFHQLLLRLEHRGEPQDLGDYALAALAAREGRFTAPSADRSSVLSTLDCGLHLDQRLYAEVLRGRAEADGVTRLGGEVAGLELSEPGAIESVQLADGRRITADLFIDCTPQGRLIGALGVGVEDWGALTPFDRIATAVVASRAQPDPFTRFTAEAAGWLRRTPLQGAEGLALAYSSQALDDAGAARRLQAAAGDAVGVDPRSRPLLFGRRTAAWSKNCVALGDAAGSPGPLPGADLHLVQTGVRRLLSLFPHGQDDGAAVREYNRLTAAEAERLRDFTLVQYRANGRRGDPVWDACREGPLPDPLAYKLRLFESRGRTPMLEEETFPEASWAAVLLAEGDRPRRYDAQADAAPEAQLKQTLSRMRQAMSQAVGAMPTHAQYLAAHCPTTAPELVS
jgi:tryptophan halogenase